MKDSLEQVLDDLWLGLIQLAAAALTIILCFVFILAVGLVVGLLWPNYFYSEIGKILTIGGSAAVFFLLHYWLHREQ